MRSPLIRDVHVLRVDGSSGGNLVRLESLAVVQRRPLVRGEQLRGVAQRGERPVVLEHPRIDHLAGEELGRRSELIGEQTLRGPAGRAAVGVARLVHDGIQRIARETGLRLDAVPERR